MTKNDSLSAVRVVSLMLSAERRDNEPLNLQVWDVICFLVVGGGAVMEWVTGRYSRPLLQSRASLSTRFALMLVE